MLEVTNLSVHYGRVVAVSDVAFRVPAGQVVALLGANGAGKSSILKGVAGLAPSKGEVRLNQAGLNKMPTHLRVAAGLALSPEGRHVFPSMTVRENLELGYRPGTRSVEEAMNHMFALFPRLQERLSQKAGSMSGGEQQMLAIARALMSSPGVLMLDEPTLGLAPLVVEELRLALRRLRNDGLAVLLAEQNAEFALASSDTAYVLERGAIVREGRSDELARDPAIAESYLGM